MVLLISEKHFGVSDPLIFADVQTIIWIQNSSLAILIVIVLSVIIAFLGNFLRLFYIIVVGFSNVFKALIASFGTSDTYSFNIFIDDTKIIRLLDSSLFFSW